MDILYVRNHIQRLWPLHMSTEKLTSTETTTSNFFFCAEPTCQLIISFWNQNNAKPMQK